MKLPMAPDWAAACLTVGMLAAIEGADVDPLFMPSIKVPGHPPHIAPLGTGSGLPRSG